jgi:hypothetical protein
MRVFAGVALSMMMVAAGLLSAFFCYYTIRLAYVNVAVPATAAHRGHGMLIGAVAFPAAAAIFGWIAWRCGRSLGRRVDAHNKNS